MATEEFDVIVVGAGISGLSSAKLLREQGVNVVVLEARDRVGGRTYSVHNDRCGYVDLGGAYVGPTQNRLLRLADELGVEHYPVNEKEDVVYFMKDYVKRYQSLQAPPTRNPFAIIDILNFLTKLDDYGSKIPIEAPWKCKYAEEWDNKTFKDFMDEEIWTAECYGLGKMLVRVLVACEPSEVSMLWFIWYIAQGHGVLRITSITNGAQERKFIGGAQTISNKMAELLKPENRLRLQHVVTTVTQEDYTVIVTTADNKVFKAKHLIMAIPTNIQHKITFTPTLPSLRNQLIQRSPMGSIIKAHVYYDTAFWREQGMCGSAVILDDDAIVCFIMDDTKPDGSYPGIIGFIAGNNARRLCTCTREERKMEFGKIVAKAFNSDKGLHPVHYEENNWMEEQFTGGCYTSTMPPGVLTKFARTMREPIGRMYFAGTETATEWSGYMDGAVQAGERAAREVLHEMGKISKDEIWQEEPDNQSVYPKPFNMSFFERHCPSVPTFIASGVLATVMGVSAVVLAVGSRLGYIDMSAWI